MATYRSFRTRFQFINEKAATISAEVVNFTVYQQNLSENWSVEPLTTSSEPNSCPVSGPTVLAYWGHFRRQKVRFLSLWHYSFFSFSDKRHNKLPKRAKFFLLHRHFKFQLKFIYEIMLISFPYRFHMILARRQVALNSTCFSGYEVRIKTLTINTVTSKTLKWGKRTAFCEKTPVNVTSSPTLDLVMQFPP